MAGTDVVDLLFQTRAALKQTKRERAAAMDAIVDMALERVEMKRMLAGLVEALDGTPAGGPLSVDAIAAHILAKDYLRRV